MTDQEFEKMFDKGIEALAREILPYPRPARAAFAHLSIAKSRASEGLEPTISAQAQGIYGQLVRAAVLRAQIIEDEALLGTAGTA